MVLILWFVITLCILYNGYFFFNEIYQHSLQNKLAWMPRRQMHKYGNEAGLSPSGCFWYCSGFKLAGIHASTTKRSLRRNTDRSGFLLFLYGRWRPWRGLILKCLSFSNSLALVKLLYLGLAPNLAVSLPLCKNTSCSFFLNNVNIGKRWVQTHT